ncbi:unnamed protein product [Rhizophagus irregularis]|nr:unnamed protein product [Rhizophagus irregularis]
MFKRSGTNNNDNDYAGTSGSGNNFNVSEVIDDTDHKSDRETKKLLAAKTKKLLVTKTKELFATKTEGLLVTKTKELFATYTKKLFSTT